ncbi:hypothetical protein [Frondihabitans sp. PAMC 28766]|uniref:hypothetical protein n=1 Tax=Frondihabitans sp. PAMC 28766 TaxID=1795630 RepID=UPI00194DD183|nr:hypothetical protein [Frondihabitans sp. PAMC 28766]
MNSMPAISMPFTSRKDGRRRISGCDAIGSPSAVVSRSWKSGAWPGSAHASAGQNSNVSPEVSTRTA